MGADQLDQRGRRDEGEGDRRSLNRRIAATGGAKNKVDKKKLQENNTKLKTETYHSDRLFFYILNLIYSNVMDINCLLHQRGFIRSRQGVTKKCRLSWLTNRALVYEPKCGGGGVAGSQPMSIAVQMVPKYTVFWISNSIFNQWEQETNPPDLKCPDPRIPKVPQHNTYT